MYVCQWPMTSGNADSNGHFPGYSMHKDPGESEECFRSRHVRMQPPKELSAEDEVQLDNQIQHLVQIREQNTWKKRIGQAAKQPVFSPWWVLNSN